MKNRIRQILLLGLIAAFSIAGIGTDAEINDPDPDVSEFEFSIEMATDVVKLSCAKGCAWKTLSFRTVKEDAYLIDYYGVHMINTEENIAESSDSDYLIAIQRDVNHVSMKGFKGTAWLNLEYRCTHTECNRTINKFGMQKSDLD